MKNHLLSTLLLLGCCLLFPLSTEAQDTIVVQTITLEDDFRAGVFEFPNDPGQTYEKILMRYQMRCHDLAVGNGNVGCREWDYSCNTFITDSARTDSNRAVHPNYIISNFSGTSFDYTSQPTYTYQQYQQYQIDYNNTITESQATVGTGSESMELTGNQSVAKTQHLFTATELTTAGFAAGPISGLRVDVAQLGTDIDFLRIRLKASSKTELDPLHPDLDGFTEVYFLNTTFPNTGTHTFNFYNNFDWDGTSNLIVEFSHTGSASFSPVWVNSHDAGFAASIFNKQDDYALLLAGAGTVPLDPSPFVAAMEEVTVAMWLKGNSAVMPANSTIFEGVDANGARQINSHTPWGNGQVYWDCGNDGGGYDRINQPANESDYEGQWNHWAFTKNAATGQMRIYLNGNLWLSGTNRNKWIETITRINLGSSANGGNKYNGSVDNFQIWRAELDQTGIQQIMQQPVDAASPYYGDLIYDYRMNEGTGNQLGDASSNALVANIDGSFNWEQTRGKDLYKNFTASNFRPNLTFVSGTYDISETVATVMDSSLNAQNQVISYAVDGTDLVITDTFFVFAAGETYVYDEAGNIVNTISIPTETTLAIEDLEYYHKFPGKYEILSLVTPYGNGLDLGPNGKTFTFDVSDYAPILKGKKRLSVEMGGQNQEELDIRFLFITGTPARPVQDIQNIWPFRRGYFAPIQNDDVFEPRTVALSSDGESFKVRSSITGHGQNGEFVSRDHYMNVNGGSNEFVYAVWKECGGIPIYPQGGTWLFDRAGWCPGDPTTVHHFDLDPYVNSGESIELDYGVLGANMDQANYLVSNQLVTYGAPSFNADAALVDVVRPSKKVEHERFNPACNLPIVVIQNTGANTLTSLQIDYQVRGGNSLTYNWEGSLEMMETEEVVLPVDDLFFWDSDTGEQVFEVTISMPNGNSDEYANNNFISSAYDLATIFEGEFRLRYNTNNRASENQLFIKNAEGEVVLQRTVMQNNTTYEDDLLLPNGCYTMEFTDSGDDGLYYWFWDVQGLGVGTGYIRFERHFGNSLYIPERSFEPEFGSFVQFDFVLSDPLNTENPEQRPSLISLSPNPTQDIFYLDLIGFEGRDLQLDLMDATGRQLQAQSIEKNGQHELQVSFDLSTQPDGLYLIRIDDGTTTKYKKVVKQTE